LVRWKKSLYIFRSVVDWAAGCKLVCTLQGRTQGRLGLKPPLELDILQKLYYLRKGD